MPNDEALFWQGVAYAIAHRMDRGPIMAELELRQAAEDPNSILRPDRCIAAAETIREARHSEDLEGVLELARLREKQGERMKIAS